MKKLLSIAVLSTVLFAFGYAGGKQYSLGGGFGKASVSVTTTYVNSQVDTLVIPREGGVAEYSIGVWWQDSVQLGTTTAGKVIRVTGGAQASFVASDTLSNFTNFTSTTNGSTAANIVATFLNGKSLSAQVTLEPLFDNLLVIITYGASGNGVSSPNVTYYVQKRYAVK